MQKMMQTTGGFDRENSMKEQIMGMMDDRDQAKKLIQMIWHQDDLAKEKIMYYMNNREGEGFVKDMVKEKVNGMSLDEMIEMMDADNGHIKNMMQIMHKDDDYTMK